MTDRQSLGKKRRNNVFSSRFGFSKSSILQGNQVQIDPAEPWSTDDQVFFGIPGNTRKPAQPFESLLHRMRFYLPAGQLIFIFQESGRSQYLDGE